MTNIDSITARLVELAAECLQLAATLKKQAETSTSPVDELLTVAQVQARYGMGRSALDARGIQKARFGRAYRWRVSDIETSIQAEPPKPRPRKLDASIEDPLERLIASGRVVRGTK